MVSFVILSEGPGTRGRRGAGAGIMTLPRGLLGVLKGTPCILDDEHDGMDGALTRVLFRRREL